MKSVNKYTKNSFPFLFIFVQFLLCLQSVNFISLADENNNKISSSQLKKNINKDEKIEIEYLLGPGDVIYIDFLDAKFFNSTYSITQEGDINLPEIGNFSVNGKTIAEIEKELKNKYSDILYSNDINVFIVSYRPINIYIKGEVNRPGLYNFPGVNTQNEYSPNQYNQGISKVINPNILFKKVTLYEIISEAQGVTNYANLSNIIVFRNNSKTNGGGRIKASINLLSLLEKGDQSPNIRMFDGDTVVIPKGKRMLKDQILSVNKSNLSPDEISIFITGNVENPGRYLLRQGSSLNQAIATTGGTKIFTGKINFIRFNADGTTTKRSFNPDESAPINTQKNPILMTGDIVDVNKSIFGKANNAISEVTRPIVNSFGLYKLFTD
tara:strand:- start:101 stop:1246 length:1146 start_codon:yes stop_codon:yes gene_type:complete